MSSMMKSNLKRQMENNMGGLQLASPKVTDPSKGKTNTSFANGDRKTALVDDDVEKEIEEYESKK